MKVPEGTKKQQTAPLKSKSCRGAAGKKGRNEMEYKDYYREHYFVVEKPPKKAEDGSVKIYELFGKKKEYRYELPLSTWLYLEDTLKATYLREHGIKIRWNRKTILDRMFGKEMMVLLWGIQGVDPSAYETAIINWLGLAQEERWWLYTMTNAATGHPDDSRGWRKALRHILCGKSAVYRHSDHAAAVETLLENASTVQYV